MRIINWPDQIYIQAAITETSNILVPELRDAYVVDEIIPAKRSLPTRAKCKKGGFALAFTMNERYSTTFPKPQILKVFFQYWKEDFEKSSQRYKMIHSFVFTHDELKDYFVNFHFIENALNVDGEILPGIRMDLVKGDTLGEFFMKCREHGQYTNGVFTTLSHEFLRMCHTFRRLGIAHGDLSNKNIIVTQGHHLKLIDYDSLYVPAMGRDYVQTTLGDVHFQHPGRGKEGNSYASNRDDNFSQIVIYTILLALSKNPSLLQVTTEDEVFMAEDFLSESSLLNSRAYRLMAEINDPDVNKMLQLLRQAVKGKCKEVPFLVDIIGINQSASNNLQTSLAKYCHKCGCRFGNKPEKYCPNCGEKRIPLNLKD